MTKETKVINNSYCLLFILYYYYYHDYFIVIIIILTTLLYCYYYYSHLHVARRRSFFYSCSTIILLTIPILSILSVFLSSSLIPDKGFHIRLQIFTFYFISLSVHPPTSPSLPVSLHNHHHPVWHFQNSFTHSEHPQSLPTKHNPQATNSTSLLQVLQPSEHSVCLSLDLFHPPMKEKD